MLSQHPPTTTEQEVAPHHRQFRNAFGGVHMGPGALSLRFDR